MASATPALADLRRRLAGLLPKAAFDRAAALLVGGTAIGQLVTVAASPFLSRLYEPSDFGTLAVYTSFLSLFGALAPLSYHQAIPVPETDEEAANLFGVASISTTLIAALAGLLMALFGQALVVRMGAPGLAPFLWMVPLGVWALSIHEIVLQWAVRKKNFKDIASTTVVRGFAQIGTQLALGVLGVAPFGLLLGQLIGQWSGSGRLLSVAWQGDKDLVPRLSTRSLAASASRFREFPLWSAPAVLLNTISLEAPPLLLAFFFGDAVTGLYALGARVMSMPITLVAKSAAQVFFASAAEASRTGRLGEETGAVYAKMIRTEAALVLLIGVAAPDLFAVVFGEAWRQAGVYAQWLVPWVGLAFVAFPLMPLISVCGRQRAGMFWQGALMASRVGALVIGGLAGSASLAVGLFGLGSGLCLGAYTAWLLRLGGASLGRAARDTAGPLAEGIAACIPVLCVQWAGLGSYAVFAVWTVSALVCGLRLLRARGAR